MGCLSLHKKECLNTTRLVLLAMGKFVKKKKNGSCHQCRACSFFFHFVNSLNPLFILVSWLLKALVSWSRVMKECWSWRIFSLFCSFSATLPIYWSFMINDVFCIAFGGEPPLLVDFKQTYMRPNHMGWITHLKENQLLHEPIQVQEHCPWHSCDPKHGPET